MLKPGFYRSIKRTLDTIAAVLLLTLLSPILLFIIAVIFFTEGRPIFYVSKRQIHGNKEVRIFKFRSMVVEATDPKHYLNERFMKGGYLDIPLSCEVYTPIGRFLEKTQLVEIMQLFNVLRDGMSLVGNRPLPASNVELLKKHEGWGRRFQSPSGLTGVSQVVGKLHLTTEERLELENLYSQVYRCGNVVKCDIHIVLKTIRLILFKNFMTFDEAKAVLLKCLPK